MLIDDYFNKDGKYLGKDNATSDNVKIISEEDWDKNKSVNDDGSETIDHKKGIELSSNVSDEDLTTEANLSIYEHYDESGSKLYEVKDLKVGMQFNSRTDEIGIRIIGNRTAKISDHANEIKNLFVHEYSHSEDKKNGTTRILDGVNEMNACWKQMEHETWKDTRPVFRGYVTKYFYDNIGVVKHSK